MPSISEVTTIVILTFSPPATQAYCNTLSQLSHTRKPSHLAHFRSRSEDTALPVFNYSSQTRNSAQQALASIRDGMGTKKRYTFCQEYLFGTFDPASLEEERKKQKSVVLSECVEVEPLSPK